MRAVILAATLISLLCLCGLTGCEKSEEGTLEEAGKQLDDAAKDAGDALDEATQ